MSVIEQVREWSDQERADALREILQFPLGQKTFEAWCETTITCPLEYCILRKQGDDWQILLYRRPVNDPYYPAQWHITGGVLLPGQKPKEVWKRISGQGRDDKYGLASCSFGEPQFIGAIDTPKGLQAEGYSPRGQERNIIHVVRFDGGEIAKDPAEWSWFSLNSLPGAGADKLIGHHARYVWRVLLPWMKQKYGLHY